MHNEDVNSKRMPITLDTLREINPLSKEGEGLLQPLPFRFSLLHFGFFAKIAAIRPIYPPFSEIEVNSGFQNIHRGVPPVGRRTQGVSRLGRCHRGMYGGILRAWRYQGNVRGSYTIPHVSLKIIGRCTSEFHV